MILYIIGIIAVFLIIILYLPIGIGAKYEEGAFVIVKIAFLKFDVPINKVIGKSKKKSKNKSKDKKDKDENALDKSIVGLDFILSLFGDFRKFVRRHFTLSDFNLDVTFGTADAASTSIISGHLWGLSYNLLALADKLIHVKMPQVKINPVFNDAVLKVKAKGIITTTLAHIIATAIVFAYKFLKYKQTRRKTK